MALPQASGVATGKQSYVGCFIDASDRDLREAEKGDNGMSLEVCAENCRAKSFAYFAVQGGRDCLCGNKYGRYGQAPEAECKDNCWGNGTQKCGGPWRNSVYKVGAAPAAVAARPAAGPTGTYVGCFIDAGDRDLREAEKGDNGMSLQVCAENCRSHNFSYYAVQGGRDCLCSNSYGRYGQAPEAECKDNCWGNGTQKCGGPWRNSVYRIR
jgi:glucan endo-1,3-alpha-glucosidase